MTASGRLGLSQTKLKITSQLFINKFTTILDDLICLLLLPQLSTVYWMSYFSFLIEIEVNLRPTVSRPVRPGVGLPSGAHDQIFAFSLTIAGFLMWSTLSD
jgi:hypothetical protein